MQEAVIDWYRWLVDGSLRLCLILLPVIALVAISRRTPSAVLGLLLASGFGLAMVVPFFGWAPFKITLPLLEITQAYEVDLPAGIGRGEAIALTALPPAGLDPDGGGWGLPQVAVSLWAAGALFFLLRRGWQHLSVVARFVRAVPVPAEHPSSVLLRSLAGERAPWLFHAETVPGPVTQGLFHPRLLIATETLERPAEWQELVFRHEIAHLSRHDMVVRAVLELVAIVFWFHPLVHLALRQYDLVVEMACDDAVLDGGVPAARYGEALVREAKESKGGRRLMREIRRRLWSILRTDKRREAPSARTAAGYVLWFLAALLPLALVGFSPYPRNIAFKPLEADERLGAWWRMKIGRGDVVDDWSGHGRHGRIIGATWVVDAERGDCLQFDGKDDILVLPGFESDWTRGPFSLSMWLKLPPETDGGGLLLRGDFNQTWSAAIAHMGDSVFHVFGERELHLSGKHGPDGGSATTFPGRYPTFDAFGINDDQATEPLPQGRWVHLALVVDSSGLERYVRFYIDSRPAGELSLDLAEAPMPNFDWEADYWYFGRGESPPVHGNLFEGMMSDLAVFNMALTPSQVAMAMEGKMSGIFEPMTVKR